MRLMFLQNNEVGFLTIAFDLYVMKNFYICGCKNPTSYPSVYCIAKTYQVIHLTGKYKSGVLNLLCTNQCEVANHSVINTKFLNNLTREKYDNNKSSGNMRQN